MARSAACTFLSLVLYHANAVFLQPKPISKNAPESRTRPVSNGTQKLSSAEKLADAMVHNLADEAHLAQPAQHLQNVPMLTAKNSSSQHLNLTWGSGVVHFLFLVNDRLPHAEIWREFFTYAPPGSWKVFVHCKDPEGCARNGVTSNNPGFQQVQTTPTWYCHDLVTAMSALTKAALDSNAASLGGREKFVFLSDSTLPIKPFNEIHRTLLMDDNSDMCLFPSDQWASARIDGSFVKLLKHHQWVVLSSEHARLFVRDWVPVNANSQWNVWLKSGTWQSNQRKVWPQSFYYPASANTCTDEWAFMATIFGAMEELNGARYLPGFGGGHIDMDSHTTQGRCRTWTYWDNAWDQATTALGSQIANDFYGSRMSCYPKCHARPATLQKLSHSSLHALRRSPFLFARKFSSDIWMPHFYSIVLSPG